MRNSLYISTLRIVLFCAFFMLINTCVIGQSPKAVNVVIRHTPESKPVRLVLPNAKLQAQIEFVHAEMFAQHKVDVSYYYHPLKDYKVGYKLIYRTDNGSVKYTIFYNLKHKLQFTAYTVFEQNTAILIYFNSFDRVHGKISDTNGVDYEYFDSNNNLISEELFGQLFTKLLP